MKRIITWLTIVIMMFSLVGCSSDVYDNSSVSDTAAVTETVETASTEEEVSSEDIEESSEEAEDEETEKKTTTVSEDTSEKKSSNSSFSLKQVPDYDDSPYVTVNGGEPYFKNKEITDESYESYSSLDSLGRCGVAVASISTDIMPTEERGSIGSVKPSGWHTVKYDFVDGKYLYNRCHLIGYQLTGENANKKNLITGTRYLNVEGMLPFENMVADYIEETGNHVMYRVTPIFKGKELVARGVLMEAYSVEDEGDGICFCVYCYNVQPGVTIDYKTGDSESDGTLGSGESSTTAKKSSGSGSSSSGSSSKKTYILNTSTKKFHLPECSAVKQMSSSNKVEFTGTRKEVIAQGYEACKLCNP